MTAPDATGTLVTSQCAAIRWIRERAFPDAIELLDEGPLAHAERVLRPGLEAERLVEGTTSPPQAPQR